LRERVVEDEFESSERLIEPTICRASFPFRDLAVKAVDENCECGQQQNVHHPDMRDVPVNLARSTRGVHVCEFCKAISFWRRSGTTLR